MPDRYVQVNDSAAPVLHTSRNRFICVLIQQVFLLEPQILVSYKAVNSIDNKPCHSISYCRLEKEARMLGRKH